MREIRRDTPHSIVIRTLEGDMYASVGDWIIRGVQGEFYPCKPDVFAATYEAVAAVPSGTEEPPHCPRCHGDGIDPDCDGRDEFNQFACTACDGTGRPATADPIRPERLAEIRKHDAAFDLAQPHPFPTRVYAHRRELLAEVKRLSAELAAREDDVPARITAEMERDDALAEVDRLTAELAKADAENAKFRSELNDDMARETKLTAELAKAREDQQWLAALEAAGVDNWQGYDTARQLQREADLKTATHAYDVIVWLMEDNRIFGADGWTWCKVIDGDPDDYTGDLPRCADEADARAKAAAWLASVTAAVPTAEGDPA